jgi:exonuclease SbcD
MRFTFIHAADLHIDSPFAGLGLKDPVVAERFAHAGRRAVEALIDETISAKAAFLVISGDIFDGDWKDVTTGLFFARALGRLDREGIQSFIVKGNHDAESLISKSLPYPESVRIFASVQPESIPLEALRVVLHGRSFGARLVGDDFVASYPTPREGWFNIGVLHTALDGTRGHESYAPCTVDDLSRFGYDYWALGHVHAAEEICRDPWIVYPGNIQGRNVRETGPKGAMRVVVEDGRVVSVSRVPLDVARWEHVRVEASDCDDEEKLLKRIESQLSATYAETEGGPLAARVTLEGVTPLHAQLVARREAIEADARAFGFRVAEDCWVEQIKIMTHGPAGAAVASEDDAFDIEAVLRDAAEDPDFTQALAELINQVMDKLPRSLRNELPADASALASLAAEARDRLLGELAMEMGA